MPILSESVALLQSSDQNLLYTLSLSPQKKTSIFVSEIVRGVDISEMDDSIVYGTQQQSGKQIILMLEFDR